MQHVLYIDTLVILVNTSVVLIHFRNIIHMKWLVILRKSYLCNAPPTCSRDGYTESSKLKMKHLVNQMSHGSENVVDYMQQDQLKETLLSRT